MFYTAKYVIEKFFSSLPNWFWFYLFQNHLQYKKTLKTNLNFLLHVAIKRVSCIWINIMIVSAKTFLHVKELSDVYEELHVFECLKVVILEHLEHPD